MSGAFYTLRAFAQEIDLSAYDIGYGAMGNGVTGLEPERDRKRRLTRPSPILTRTGR